MFSRGPRSAHRQFRLPGPPDRPAAKGTCPAHAGRFHGAWATLRLSRLVWKRNKLSARACRTLSSTPDRRRYRASIPQIRCTRTSARDPNRLGRLLLLVCARAGRQQWVKPRIMTFPAIPACSPPKSLGDHLKTAREGKEDHGTYGTAWQAAFMEAIVKVRGDKP